MLLDNALGVLDGHHPASELHHARAEGLVFFVKRRAKRLSHGCCACLAVLHAFAGHHIVFDRFCFQSGTPCAKCELWITDSGLRIVRRNKKDSRKRAASSVLWPARLALW